MDKGLISMSEITSKIKELIKNLPEDQTLRVLEVGAGTGGMTQAILLSLTECLPLLFGM